jgi:hypothetical protein
VTGGFGNDESLVFASDDLLWSIALSSVTVGEGETDEVWEKRVRERFLQLKSVR